jgi:hypothetical protein
MNALHCFNRIFISITAVSIIFSAVNGPAFAHCDTLDWPVVQEARTALETGDVTPLLKWVRVEDEKEIKTAFENTLLVRKLGAEAKDRADMYFFETLVRIHRAGEGAPYTGLKPGVEADPAVVLADEALEDGSVSSLVEILTSAMADGIHERFRHTMETQAHAGNSVPEGREFVRAYVVFTHYVEALHTIVRDGDILH